MKKINYEKIRKDLVEQKYIDADYLSYFSNEEILEMHSNLIDSLDVKKEISDSFSRETNIDINHYDKNEELYIGIKRSFDKIISKHVEYQKYQLIDVKNVSKGTAVGIKSNNKVGTVLDIFDTVFLIQIGNEVDIFDGMDIRPVDQFSHRLRNAKIGFVYSNIKKNLPEIQNSSQLDYFSVFVDYFKLDYAQAFSNLLKEDQDFLINLLPKHVRNKIPKKH